MEKVYRAMLTYQKENNITQRCITNALYFKDCLNANGQEATVRAVLARWINQEQQGYQICVHMVVDIGNNRLIDPSYEITSLKGVEYLEKIHLAYPKELMNCPTQGLTQRECIEKFLEFLAIAKRINGGENLSTGLEYYHAQADYVERVVSTDTHI